MFVLALRHLIQHWRLSLGILLGLSLATSLLAGLAAYGDVVAARSLNETMLRYPAPEARNILVTGTEETRLEEGVYSTLANRLGGLIMERVDVRQFRLPVYEPPRQRGELRPSAPFHFVQMWAFDKLGERVRVVDGRLPTYDNPAGSPDNPNLEVAVGADGASRTGLQVGDVVTVDAPAGPADMTVVGILEPLNPEEDIWWGDHTTFDVRIKLIGRSSELITVSLFVPPQAIVDRFPDHDLSWRILVDSGAITVDNAGQVQETLTNLQAQLKNQHAELRSGLPETLVHFRRDLVTVRMTLGLLIAQASIVLLYTLWESVSFLLDRTQSELATLAVRGGNRFQITLLFALEGLLLALPAALLGPLLVASVLCLWGTVTKHTVPTRIGDRTWVLAFLAIGVAWLTFVLLVVERTGRRPLPPTCRVDRPEHPGWQRWYADIILLVIGGALYWQLARSGSFIMRWAGATPLTDPFLLLGSSVLMIAAALLILRLSPYLFHLAAWIARAERGFLFSTGLTHLGRAPLEPGKVVLLVSVTASLILFSNTFVSSLSASQVETAHYLAGADLRISSSEVTDPTMTKTVSGLPGVLVTSPVIRADLRDRQGRTVNLLAVDPETFAQVTYYPPEQNQPSMSSLLEALQRDTPAAIVSRSLVSGQDAVGEQITLSVGSSELVFEVSTIVEEFPTLSEMFIVTDWHTLGQQIDLSWVYFRLGEFWLETDPDQHDALVSNPALAGEILADSQAELQGLKTNAIAHGLTTAFRMDSLALGMLGVTGTLLMQVFAAQKHTCEIARLRTIGLAPTQLMGLRFLEGVLTVAVGLLAGVGIGYELVQTTLPYLSRALAASLVGVEINRIVIDWPTVIRLYVLLTGCHVLALAFSLLIPIHTGLRRASYPGER